LQFFLILHRYQIPKETPSVGGVKYMGVGKLAIFDWNHRLSRKQYEIG